MSKKLMTNAFLKLKNIAGYTVNFIVGCKVFKTFFKRLRSSVECHGRKQSSIYLLNNSSINLQWSWEKYFGSLT